MKLSKICKISRLTTTFKAFPSGGFKPYSKLVIVIFGIINIPIPFTEKEESIKH
jgi:hypothetical protein